MAHVDVLYITYNGLTEPLGRRQVIPYLVALSRRGWRFTVISFEKPETATAEAVRHVREILDGSGTRWIALRYHRRPTVPATAFDVAHGLVRGLGVARHKALIHARSSVPAFMAASVSRALGVPWIYDVRGLVAEEYADAGHWNRDGALHRRIERAESRLLHRASGVVFLTDRIQRRLRSARALPQEIPSTVIPCCVDLDVFHPIPEEARRSQRTELGLGERPVLVYAGSLGSWYRIDEMLDFFAVARREIEGLQMLVLTPQVALAETAARKKGLTGNVVTRSLPPDDVPAALAAADGGICFLGDKRSKEASSPTKYGEYLGSGLPVVTNRYIGDSAELDSEPAWILVDSFDETQYASAARRLATLFKRGESKAREARDLARRRFDVEMAAERYDRLYRRVLDER